MPDIEIVKPHTLTIAKAKAAVQHAIDELGGEYNLKSEWHGHMLHIHRSGVEGEVQVTGSEIRIDITLGFLLKPFKAKLVDHIERGFRELSTNPRPALHRKQAARKPERHAR